LSTSIGKPGDLLGSGPLVAVKLWVPQQVKSTIPPIDTLAEISTSALHTCIQEGVATSLGLNPKGTVKITTATNQAYESYAYQTRIVFPHGKAVEILAAEVPYMIRSHVRIKCVIGRDILRLGVLIYNGRGNTFLFDF
jgi:hypothetical protein